MLVVFPYYAMMQLVRMTCQIPSLSLESTAAVLLSSQTGLCNIRPGEVIANVDAQEFKAESDSWIVNG